MKPEKIFIGDIKLCIDYNLTKHCFDPNEVVKDEFGNWGEWLFYSKYTERSERLLKKDAILLEVAPGCYVDVSNIKSILDYIKIYFEVKNNLYNGLVIRTHTIAFGQYVEKSSIRPYFDNKQQETNESTINTTLKRHK